MTPQTVFSPIAVMIDAETLALSPNAFVTQVGVCVANTATREYIWEPQNFWLTNEGQEGRLLDPETVRFWVQQDRTVANGVFFPPENITRTSPRELFDLLKHLCLGEGSTVWASPAMFDLPLITSLCRDKPWSYRQERCMMTLYKLLDPTGDWQPPQNLKAHDAAADAKWQMEYLFSLLDLLRNNNMLQEGA